MPRAKVAGDDQAAAELDRMAVTFASTAERYRDEHERMRVNHPNWPTREQFNESQAQLRGLVIAYERACASLVLRASRLRNGTAGR